MSNNLIDKAKEIASKVHGDQEDTIVIHCCEQNRYGRVDLVM